MPKCLVPATHVGDFRWCLQILSLLSSPSCCIHWRTFTLFRLLYISGYNGRTGAGCVFPVRKEETGKYKRVIRLKQDPKLAVASSFPASWRTMARADLTWLGQLHLYNFAGQTCFTSHRAQPHLWGSVLIQTVGSSSVPVTNLCVNLIMKHPLKSEWRPLFLHTLLAFAHTVPLWGFMLMSVASFS